VIALPPQQIPLDIDCFVIGRESDCHLAIPSQMFRPGTWVTGVRGHG
jgi:hypothetical protein